MTSREIKAKLRRLGNRKAARLLQGFFKTGSGEYGEGDIFLGIKVPVLRKLAGECPDLDIKTAATLLKSHIHEERLFALLILVRLYSKGGDTNRIEIFRTYLHSTRHINNWDLVDLTAPNIVGVHLASINRKPLYRLAKSQSLWERRIAIIATSHFIRLNDFADTLRIAKILINDEEDLIHKAVGWMLREVGKRDLRVEEAFLKPRYNKMPRTMLRYAIERFPEEKRKRYLNGTI